MKTRILFFLITLMLSSILINYSLGYHGAKGIDIIYVTSLLLALFSLGSVRYLFLLPLFVCAVVYMPIAVIYGPPSLSNTASLLQTTPKEALEFLCSLPFSCYIYSLIIIACFCCLSASDILVSIPTRAKKALVIFFVLLNLILIHHGNIFEIKPIKFIRDAVISYKDYKQQMNDLIDPKPGNWENWGNANHYKNIIIIVGESMRADYMSVYGYPLNTTPFLNSVHGKFYKNYISTAPNTFLSLPRTLALSSGTKFNISYNILDLGEQAGLDTFWISNQGFLGKFDTPSTKLALYANKYIFLKKGDFESNNHDDFELIPQLTKILDSKSERSRLIILHIMGSHPLFSERLNGEPATFHFKNSDLSDYISTYIRTDKFIRDVYEKLSDSKKPFKLFYFSDHGLSERNVNGELLLRHGSLKKQNYHIPLIILSSDERNKREIDTPISAFNFIPLFCSEVGIKVKSPSIEQRSLSSAPIEIYNGASMENYDNLEDEPAIILH